MYNCRILSRHSRILLDYLTKIAADHKARRSTAKSCSDIKTCYRQKVFSQTYSYSIRSARRLAAGERARRNGRPRRPGTRMKQAEGPTASRWGDICQLSAKDPAGAGQSQRQGAPSGFSARLVSPERAPRVRKGVPRGPVRPPGPPSS